MSGETSTTSASVIGTTSAAQATTDSNQQAQQTTTQQQAAPAGFKFPDGFDYKQIVPEDIRNDPVFAKYKDIDGVFRGLHGAQKLIGKDPSNLLEIPAPTDEAGVRAAMNRLGASEKAEDYKLEPVKDAPDWLGGDQELGAWFKGEAHKHGIPTKAANALYQGFVGTMMKSIAAQQAAAVDVADKAIASLKAELGDDFDGSVRRAKLAISKLGGEPLRQALEGADLGAHPAVIKALAEVGKFYQEGTDGGDDKGQGGDQLPSEIKAEGMDLIAKSHATNDPVEKQRLQKQAREKFERARGGKKV